MTAGGIAMDGVVSGAKAAGATATGFMSSVAEALGEEEKVSMAANFMEVADSTTSREAAFAVAANSTAEVTFTVATADSMPAGASMEKGTAAAIAKA